VTTATLTTTALTVGSHAITAVYNGDTDDLGATSTASTVAVAQDATTVTVVASSSGPVFGQPVTLKATVNVVKPGAGVPTGTVTFMDGATVLGTAALVTSSGVTTATLTTTALSVGSHAITADYNGDTDDRGATSTASTVAVAQDKTTTTVTASPSGSVYGQPVTFVAKVAVASPGAGTPTGRVTFLDGNTTLGTAPLVTSGGVTTASFTTASLSPGSHAITAVYGADAADLGSTSAKLNFNVAQDATTVAVLASSPAPVYGQPVTFQATVALSGTGFGTPTGTVTFKDGNTTLGTAALAVSGGVATATFTTASLGMGHHSITAVYSGDTDHAASTSATLDLPVAPDGTVTTLVAAPTSSVYGQSVTFTATVAATAPGVSTPTGTVTFMDGSTTLGTGKLSTVGGVTTATFTTSKLSVGSHAITAVYGGGPDDLGATSAAATAKVAQDQTTTTIKASPSFSVYGQMVTFTATVAVASPGAGRPTGTVTFMDGTMKLGTGTLSTSGGVTTATFSTSALAVGVHSITAVYSGDTDDAGSTSTVLHFTVGRGALDAVSGPASPPTGAASSAIGPGVVDRAIAGIYAAAPRAEMQGLASTSRSDTAVARPVTTFGLPTTPGGPVSLGGRLMARQKWTIAPAPRSSGGLFETSPSNS
jgi:hypothetical protein